jgi:hypothetical protein
MRRNKSRNRAKLAPLAAACFLSASGPVWGTSLNFIADTWLQPGGGTNPDWLNPSLWSTGSVPNDDPVNKYLVTIPGSNTVNLDNDPPYTAASSTVYDLDLGGGSNLNVEIPLTVEDAINGYGANINVIGSTLTVATPPAGTVIPSNIYIQSGGTATLAYSSVDMGNGGVALSSDGMGSVLDLHAVQSIALDGGNGDTISATNGGLVNLSGATSCAITSYYGGTAFSAEGAGSVVDLHGMQTIQFSSHLSDAISASNGAEINLSGLTSFQPVGGSPLFLQVGGGGTINLNSLQTIGLNNVGGTGITDFQSIDPSGAGSFSLPSLTTAQYAEFDVGTGMTISAPNLITAQNSNINLSGSGVLQTGPLSEIDNSNIQISGGAVFNSVSATSYTTTNYNGNTLSADGAGSVLDLHTVQTIGFSPHISDVISATNGAVVNLSGLTSVEPLGGGTLYFQVGEGGTINLNSLQTTGVNNVGGSGTTDFQSAAPSGAGSFSLPSLVTAEFAEFDVGTGMTITAPRLANLQNSTINLSGSGVLQTGPLSEIDNSNIQISGGAVFNSVSATSYTTTNYNGNTLSADGAGSVLDLHTVQTIAFSPHVSDVVSATNGAVVNLSGLTSVEPLGGGTLYFQVGEGGTINLNSLQTIGVNNVGGSGTADFQSAAPSGAGSFSLPSLVTAEFAEFDVGTGMTITAPHLASLQNSTINLSGSGVFTTGLLSEIDNSNMQISGGAVFNSVSATSYTTTNYNGNTLSADGAGSVLDLHTVKTIAFSPHISDVISATNGAVLNLSGLTSVEPLGGGTLYFQVGQSGTINLNSLQSTGVNNVGGSGTTSFNLSTNGTINIGSSVQTQNTQFNVTDPTGNLIFGSNVNLGNTSSLNLAAGAVLQVKGSFSTAITNTSNFQASGAILNMNGNGLQTLEVAGADEGAINPGNNGNFGFGQLEIGQPTVPTEVDLVDDVDNGNRGAGNANEAFYLYGVDGQGGLVLNGGSVLLIGNLNAYSFQDGSWTDLQNLFTGGETIVSYTLNGSDGYIARNLSALQAVWQNPGSGGWNTGTNWNINTTPGIFNDVFITPVTGVTVTGPTSSTRIRSLTIDATPSGTLSVLNLSSASTITVEDNIDIGSQGQINEQAGTLTAQQTTVAGSFAQSANTTLNVSGGLTSTGGITSAGSFTVGGAFVNNGTYIQSGGSANIGSVSGTGSTNIGPGVTLNVGNFTQLGGLVSSGTVNINGGGTVKSITGNGALSIEGGTLQLAVNAGLNSVSSLSIGANAALDIGNSRLLINYGSGKDPIASIAAWIENGFFGLPGPAIVSSDIAGADAASGLSYGIGYADSADPGNPADLPSGTVEIMFTLLGDANLDGTVNSEDFTPFSHNLGQSGMMWDDGDFNYDGTVNAEDFTPFSHNLNQSAVLAAQIGVFDATANGTGLANVPEPACAGMMVMAGLGIMRRRRRAK